MRSEIPGLVIRTSLITGLPGEGEQEFAELCDFLREYKLERVGAFAFSPEEGTEAARMEYPENEVAVRRAEQIAELQSGILDSFNERFFDKTVEVLLEDYDGVWYYGRTYADSPGIDGTVRFTADNDLEIGSFVEVLILGSEDGDLIGKEAAS